MTRKNQRNSESRKKGKIQIQSSDNIYSELISNCMLEIELFFYFPPRNIPINYLIVLIHQLKNDR